MTWNLVLAAAASRTIKRAPPKDQKRLLAALESSGIPRDRLSARMDRDIDDRGDSEETLVGQARQKLLR